MTLLVAEKKSQSRLVARFPEGEFDDFISPTAERFGGPQLFVERMVRWFVKQPPELQAMIQGQVPASPELIQLVLFRLAGDESAKKHGAAKGHGVKMLKAASSKKDLKE